MLNRDVTKGRFDNQVQIISDLFTLVELKYFLFYSRLSLSLEELGVSVALSSTGEILAS